MQNANTDATLVCHANKPFDECLWTTPYGSTYSFKGSDSSHENGRISFFGFTETDCGIIVSNVGPQDNGGWLCQLHSKAGNFFQNATDVVPLFTGELCSSLNHDSINFQSARNLNNYVARYPSFLKNRASVLLSGPLRRQVQPTTTNCFEYRASRMRGRQFV